MKRFKNILFVANDEKPNETAFQRALDRAANNAARLTVVNVADAPGPEMRWVSKLIPPSKFLETLREERLAHLKDLVERFTGSGVPIELKLIEGDVFLEVIRQVLRGNHDLVIKPADSWPSATQSVFGSTDMHLMRKCPCPLWIMKLGRTERYARILAAVDPYSESREAGQLAGLIMDLATSLAVSEGAELHIVHAWRLSTESILRYGRGALPAAEVNELVMDARHEHEKALNGLLGGYPLGDLGARVHLVKGMPAEVIREQVKGNRIDLVVMGTVGRTGIPGFFIGNTAEGVLSQVDCSVLTVKPAGFKSPVELGPSDLTDRPEERA